MRSSAPEPERRRRSLGRRSRPSRETSRALIEACPDAVLLLDETGGILQVNAGVERLFGYAAHELHGRPADVLFELSRRAEYVSRCAALLAEPGCATSNGPSWLTCRHKEGHAFRARVDLGRVVDCGDVALLTNIRQLGAADLEQQVSRHLLALRRSQAELRRFTSVTSHDLREPVRLVVGLAQLLERRCSESLLDEGREVVRHIVDTALRLDTWIGDLLDYAGVDETPSRPEPTECARAVEHALQNLALVLGESDGVVTQGGLPSVRADRAQLVQLFQNLIGNALKFRGEQPPRVHISAELFGGEWVITVADNGIGIDSRDAERIFDVFQRVRTPARRPGSGIGLATCKKIVERHGGRIWVESETGCGSSFRFTLHALDN